MFEAPVSTDLIEHRRPPRRVDSFSTVNSSVAAADIMQQYSNLSEALAQKPPIMTKNPPKMKFENSDGIHVGDVVYHIHHHSEDNDISSRNSSSFESENLKKSKGKLRRFLSAKKNWIIPVIFSVLSVIAGISVTVYFIWGNNPNNDYTNDNETTTEYTTTEITTPEITTTLLNIQEYLVTRDAWGADDPKSSNIPKLKLPIKRIIIAHTRGQSCSDKNDCISTVKSIQTRDSSLDDIPYNFLIGEDGYIYEGRGFNYTGQHTQNLDATEYNSIGICIAFIGNYTSVAPNTNLLNLLKDFIYTFVEQDAITKDHIIVLQDDLKYFQPKAEALNEAIKSFKNFRPLYKIYRREEWNAKRRSNDPSNFERILNWVLIGHTETPLCSDLNSCKARARSLQDDGMSRNPPLSDILYNVFFGGDGLVFEGRGWDYWGAHAVGFNSISIGAGAIGNFTSTIPNQKMVDAMVQVFDDAMALGKLTDDYKIFGRSDFGGPGPGAPFMNIIKQWCRYGNRTSSCT